MAVNCEREKGSEIPTREVKFLDRVLVVSERTEDTVRVAW